MKELLIDIQERLTTAVVALKYIDEDWGQLDYFANNAPVKWPCALIDVTSASWSNTLNLAQMGLVQVKIRVADLKLSKSSNAAPQGQKDKSFGIFDLLSDIHKCLHGWSGHDHYSALIRTASTRVKRADGVRIYEITYTTELKDISTRIEKIQGPKFNRIWPV